MNWLPAVIAFSAGWAIPLVQYVLRPNYIPGDLPFRLFLASAPDLIVGFCFPFSILIRPAAWTEGTAAKLFCLWCLITVTAITYVEYASPLGPNVFDPNDLIFGIGGTAAAAAVYFFCLKDKLDFASDEA